MKILVACEYSGVVREAFAKKGHEVYSCDLLPSEIEGNHIQGDVSSILSQDWDMLLAFPPCTHLSVSGARYFKNKDREQQEALAFVHLLLNANIFRIALENPIGVISTKIRKPDQIIQPYQFGHDASKATCLWLKNLPKLVSTDYVEPRIVEGKKRWSNQTDSGQNKLGPSPDRGKLRSKTYQGIAEAMANQWNF